MKISHEDNVVLRLKLSEALLIQEALNTRVVDYHLEGMVLSASEIAELSTKVGETIKYCASPIIERNK